MAYGTIKVDNITFTDNSVDKTVSLSGLIQNPTFTGNVTVTGTISGDVIRGGTTISGVTVTGTTANFVSGVFTTQISGATITGTTVATTTGSFVSLTGTTATFTSGIIASGTAALPSLAILSDPNTGIYSPGADQLAISTSGTGRLFVDGSGKVGIGVTPVELLDVAGNIRQTGNTAGTANTVGLIDFYNTNSTTTIARINVRTDGATNSGSYRISTANAGTLNEVVRITSGGLVGIGTTPDTILHTAVSQAGSAAVNIFKAQATNTTDNVITRLDLSAEPALGTASVVRLSAITGNAADSSNLAFNVRNAGTSTEALRISSVGTTTLTSAASTAPFIAKISSTEVARIDSSGRLLVGTSSSFTERNWTGTGWSGIINVSKNDVDGVAQFNNWSSNASLSTFGGVILFISRCKSGTVGTQTGGGLASGDAIGRINFNGSDGSNFYTAAAIDVVVDAATSGSEMPGRLVFSTTADGAASPTERMRITNAGSILSFAASANDAITAGVASGAGATPYLFAGVHSRTGTATGGTLSYSVAANGNVQNTNGSYTTISDAKLKENIVDAGSQWDDFKVIRICNWNFKAETGHQTHRQIGPIANELEAVCPGLVFETPDRDQDGNETGEVTKGVNQSVLYMKAVKALQEAMERIETLEASNADMLARLTALEAA